MLYGYSPFECEFVAGTARVTECGYLRVIGKLPEPPRELMCYPSAIRGMVPRMLVQDHTSRPTVKDVLGMIDRARADLTAEAEAGSSSLHAATDSSVPEGTAGVADANPPVDIEANFADFSSAFTGSEGSGFGDSKDT